MVHHSRATDQQVKDRVDSQLEISIWGRVIDMPPTIAESSDDKVEQITRQVSDKLVSYVTEQVHHMETMVQDKINPTTSTSNASNISATIPVPNPDTNALPSNNAPHMVRTTSSF